MKSFNFSVVVEKDKNGYFAFVPELQGCYSQGTTYEEAMENISYTPDEFNMFAKEPSSFISFAVKSGVIIYERQAS